MRSAEIIAAGAISSLPAPLVELLTRLQAEGYAAYLVGGCVRDWLRGKPVRDFDVATDATPAAVLELFPRAVPIGLRHGTVMVPLTCGPVDVTRFRRGENIERDLAHRDFTVNAMALDTGSGKLLDPFGGANDLAAGVLRSVGSADARFAEDPLRALRAARLLSELGYELDAALEPAIAKTRTAVAGVAPERIRHELERLLLGPHASEALLLLFRTGFAQQFAPGCRSDAPQLLPHLPRDLCLRLAAWLRGTSAAAVLSQLRFPRRVRESVEQLLRLHPVERQANPQQLLSVRRLLKRAGVDGTEALFALRHAEQAAGCEGENAEAAHRLRELHAALEHVRQNERLVLERRDLALNGRAVMEILGCGPGLQVGHALHYLSECVLADSSRNQAETLRELLLHWRETQPHEFPQNTGRGYLPRIDTRVERDPDRT